jgi:hypothetical protein
MKGGEQDMWTLITAVPPMPFTFYLDVSGLLGYAEDIFNGLAPAFLPVIGITFGIAVLVLVLNVVRKAVTGVGKG